MKELVLNTFKNIIKPSLKTSNEAANIYFYLCKRKAKRKKRKTGNISFDTCKKKLKSNKNKYEYN